MDRKLKIGDHMPSFHCNDEEGQPVTNDDVIGSPLVIYFYPKDNTPGCTAEACSFRDRYEKFEETDTLILGVSPDPEHSHQQFIEQHELNFTLLSDPDLQMCHAFGVVKEGKVERSTFVINPDGIITWIEQPVQVEGHAERVLSAVNASA
jgi:peroxiredoxin Q/BCP